MTARTGYDLDGVLCADPAPWELRLYRAGWNAYVHFRQRAKRLRHRPPADALIVTGRPERDRDATLLWLRRHGVLNPVLFNAGRPVHADAVRTKVDAINAHGIGTFYESCPRQAADIAEACPAANVVVWGRR